MNWNSTTAPTTPLSLREYLGYAAFRQLGNERALCQLLCNVYINGELLGLYIGVEAVDNSLTGPLAIIRAICIKREVGATLEPEMDLDLLEQKKGRDVEKSDLTELIEILEETEPGQKGELESVLDIDLSFNTWLSMVIHNWDDYWVSSRKITISTWMTASST